MIVVDIETSGLDWRKNSMVSLGSINFENSDDSFYQECRIWDGAEIDPKALEINGFSEEEIRTNKKSIEQLIEEFLEWTKKREIKDLTLAGENVNFDISFLRDAFDRSGKEWIFGRRSVDLHSVSYFNHLKNNIVIPLINKTSKLSLDETLKYAGLRPEPIPHHALNGAKIEAECFSRLIYGKALFPEFNKFPVPEYLKINS